ncbi:unnamed protein product [Linum tenue]|uniref:RRM domain-containing protein n=1 Tax=Linum tenue TaxID=586396 RepID=A0AAV0GZX4_9ROSI|nr:unnamed protein product [Linum tenue]
MVQAQAFVVVLLLDLALCLLVVGKLLTLYSSPCGKIFIDGVAKDTTYATFNKHFGKYGEITDMVIMKDHYTGHCGFITYVDPSVVDKVIKRSRVINGKQVEIKRTIPKGSGQSKDFKTKKIFVGGIPSSIREDEFQEFFSKHGTFVEHQIIRDHETNHSRGFGFIIFDSEKVVDELLSKGNMIDMAGTQVSLIRCFKRVHNVLGSLSRWALPCFILNGQDCFLFASAIFSTLLFVCMILLKLNCSLRNGCRYRSQERAHYNVCLLPKLG